MESCWRDCWIWLSLAGLREFGWIARIFTNCPDIAEILHKIVQNARILPRYCTKLQNITQNYPSAQGTPHPGHSSFNHCHHPTPYSQQKRTAYSACTFYTPIILFFVASRSCLVSCQSDSVIVAICSLKSHRSRF